VQHYAVNLHDRMGIEVTWIACQHLDCVYCSSRRKSPGSGAEYKAVEGLARPGIMGGAGEPVEEQAWARGHSMWLLKIEEARTRMRVRDDNFEVVS
jgi:hypothetical protein